MIRRATTIVRLGLAAAIFAGLAPASGTFAQDAGPRLEMETTEKSFGVLPPTETAEVSFTLRNTGTEALTVELDVRPPLQVVSSPDTLEPGESGELVLEASLHGIQGAVAFPVKLTTNDPSRPDVSLEVTGEVTTFVQVHPGRARWKVTRGEADGTIEHSLRSSDGEPFEIVAVDLPHAALSEESVATAEDSWQLELTLDRWAPVGPITGEVVVHTTHPRQERVVIPVSGFVRPMVAVTPHEVKGEATIEEDAIEKLLVRVFTTDPLPIVSVEHDLPGIPEAELIEVEKGRTYQVWLHLPADLPKGRLQGEVRIIPEGDRAAPIVVPVDAMIR